MSTPNYVARLGITLATQLRERIAQGDSWCVEDFRELISEASKVYTDNKKVRARVYDVLSLLPRLTADDRAATWKEMVKYFSLEKHYVATKKDLCTMSDADIAAYFMRRVGAE